MVTFEGYKTANIHFRLLNFRVTGNLGIRLLPLRGPRPGGGLSRGPQTDRRVHLMLLSVSYQGPAVDLATIKVEQHSRVTGSEQWSDLSDNSSLFLDITLLTISGTPNPSSLWPHIKLSTTKRFLMSIKN